MRILENKRFVITGGSQGIGFAVAEKCVSEGAEVIIVARNEGELKESITKLSSQSTKKHRYYVLDVSDLNAVRVFAQWIVNQKLDLDGLVNCAGVYGPIGKTSTVDLIEFTKAVNINFLGTVYMCSIFAPLLKSATRKKLSIIQAEELQRHFQIIQHTQPAKLPSLDLLRIYLLSFLRMS